MCVCGGGGGHTSLTNQTRCTHNFSTVKCQLNISLELQPILRETLTPEQLAVLKYPKPPVQFFAASQTLTGSQDTLAAQVAQEYLAPAEVSLIKWALERRQVSLLQLCVCVFVCVGGGGGGYTDQMIGGGRGNWQLHFDAYYARIGLQYQ